MTGGGYVSIDRGDGKHTWERELLYINWNAVKRPHTCANTLGFNE